MARRAPDHGVAGGPAVVDVKAVNDDIGHELDGDASPVGNVDVDAAGVDRLEAVHEELLLERDDHVALEHDPEWPVLDDGVAERAGLRVDGVVVVGVAHHVVLAVAPADGVAAEADAAVGQPLSPHVPPAVAAPAVVDGVAGPA